MIHLLQSIFNFIEGAWNLILGTINGMWALVTALPKALNYVTSFASVLFPSLVMQYLSVCFLIVIVMLIIGRK